MLAFRARRNDLGRYMQYFAWSRIQRRAILFVLNNIKDGHRCATAIRNLSAHRTELDGSLGGDRFAKIELRGVLYEEIHKA